MRKANFINVTYTHTEGMETCIIPHLSYPRDSSIFEKRQMIESGELAIVKTSLLNEPRGHVAMYGGFLTPPSSDEFDAGIIWSDGIMCNDMCGHGTIALGMAMVAQGWVPESNDGHTFIRLETTAGLVTAEVKSNDESVEWTRFENVPAFLAAADIPITLPHIGDVKVDVAWGGNYFAIVKWDHPDLKVDPVNGIHFRELGAQVRQQIADKITLHHPTQSHIYYPGGITDLLVTFYHEGTRPDAYYRNVHVLSAGLLDRSPGGTGTSAMVAMFEAKGQLQLGQTIQSEGLLGSGTFEGCAVRETTIGNQRAIVPTVKGTANIIGYGKWLLDPADTVSHGFIVT